MLRSDAVTKGIQRSPNRAMLRAVGFGDSDFGKPILGLSLIHISEPTRQEAISYAVFCLKKKMNSIPKCLNCVHE